MKKAILTILLLSLIFSVNAQENNWKHTFTDLENNLMNAILKKDRAAVEKIFSGDFMLTSSMTKGEVKNKKQCLEDINSRTWTNFSTDSLIVRMYNKNSTAVVNVWGQQTATANGKDWSGKFLDTDVWIDLNGSWKLVSRHSTWLKK